MIDEADKKVVGTKEWYKHIHTVLPNIGCNGISVIAGVVGSTGDVVTCSFTIKKNIYTSSNGIRQVIA